MGYGKHFLDSGAFSHILKGKQYHKKHGGDPWAYFETEEYRSYLDSYVKFVKKYKLGIDYYANIDVIGNAELTWKNQLYLESKGLKPIPVVHYPDGIHAVRRYMDRGDDFVAFGGMVGETAKQLRIWLDKFFGDVICDSEGMPRIKIHAFGLTSYPLLWRYPWYSCDSTTWLKTAGNGCILVPPYQNGEFQFKPNTPPLIIKVSEKIGDKQHLRNLPKAEQARVREWLASIGAGDVETDYKQRFIANILYFARLTEKIPEYPRKFKVLRQKGFGLS